MQNTPLNKNAHLYWVGQKVRSSFSVRCYRKIGTKFLVNPIYVNYMCVLFSPLDKAKGRHQRLSEVCESYRNLICCVHNMGHRPSLRRWHLSWDWNDKKEPAIQRSRRRAAHAAGRGSVKTLSMNKCRGSRTEGRPSQCNWNVRSQRECGMLKLKGKGGRLDHAGACYGFWILFQGQWEISGGERCYLGLCF